MSIFPVCIVWYVNISNPTLSTKLHYLIIQMIKSLNIPFIYLQNFSIDILWNPVMFFVVVDVLVVCIAQIVIFCTILCGIRSQFPHCLKKKGL